MRTAITIVCLSTALTLAAQESPHTPAFRTNADTVLVPVTVTNHRGEILNGLRQSNFTVLEDRVPQAIVSFTGEDTPCSVGLILDLSGSMRDVLGPAKDAVRAFLATSNPDDDFFLMTVSTNPQVATSFTSETGQLERNLYPAQATGSTALIDTIYMGLQQIRKARSARRALLVVSDGMDNHSRYSKPELMSLALETDAQIYTIAIDDIPRSKKPIEVTEARRGLAFLDELSQKTGGLHFTVMSSSDINNAALKLSRALRNQYVIGYQPQNVPRYDKWRRIHVKVDLPNVNVYARNGYYSH